MNQNQNSWYKLRSEGPIPKQELTSKKLKEQLLRKLTLPVIQPPKNSGYVTIAGNTSTKTNGNTFAPKVLGKVAPPDSSIILVGLHYNIVKDMKKDHANVSIFYLTIIASQWELLVQALDSAL